MAAPRRLSWGRGPDRFDDGGSCGPRPVTVTVTVTCYLHVEVAQVILGKIKHNITEYAIEY